MSDLEQCPECGRDDGGDVTALDLRLKLRKAADELDKLTQSNTEGWRYADELEQERKRLEANCAKAELRVVELSLEIKEIETVNDKLMDDGYADNKRLRKALEAISWGLPEPQSIGKIRHIASKALAGKDDD